MTIDQLIEQRSALAASVDNEDANLDQIEADIKAINAEMDRRSAEEAKKAEIRAAVAEGKGEVIKTIEPEVREDKKMDMEIRNSENYINAYASYIKSGDATECRALLSENATNGTVAVPELVYDIVKTAWEKEGIMSRVRKSYLKGNLKVGFEISATGATIHQEGQAVSEETLVLGIVELIPTSIKKWISLSDEIYDLRGESFLRYVYDELAYRIAHKAADELLAKIIACGTASTTTCVAVPVYTSTVASVGLVAQALSNLSDEAAQPVIIMNKASWGAFKAAQAANGYNYDPFEGLPVVFNNSLKSLTAASTGDTWAIVGDLEQGALANFPNGNDITFKFDEMTLATNDLVRVVGREFVGLGVVAPNAFVKIVK